MMSFFFRSAPWWLFFLPFVLLGYWLRQYAYVEFFWDDWELIAARFPWDDMTINWSGLFTAYSGHRIPILHLSVIPAVMMAEGDPRFLSAVALLLAMGTGLLILRLVKASFSDSPITGRFLRNAEIAVVSLAVASPLFGHAWQWWICWPIFLPFTLLMVAVHLLGRDGSLTWTRLAVVLSLCVLAALSHATGAIVWLAMLPSLALGVRDLSARDRALRGAVFFAVGVAILWPFLVGGGGDDGSRDVTFAERLLKLASYGLTLVGGSLGQGIATDPVVPSRVLGAMLCAGAGAVVWAMVGRESDPELRRRLGPWVSIVAFGLLSAGVIAIGRSVLPDQQALGGRYLLLTYPIWLGLYFSVRILLESGRFRIPLPRAHSINLLGTAFLLLLQINSWFEGHRILRWNYAGHLSRVAPVDFCRVFPDNPALSKGAYTVPAMIRTVEKLDQHELLAGYRLYRSDDLAKVGRYFPMAPVAGGHLTSATTDAEGSLLVQGYAYLRESDRPADLILLTWEAPPDKTQRIFCLVPVPLRDDFYHSFERIRRPESFTDWRILLAPEQFPEGKGVVRAWAFDHEKKRIFIMRNSVEVEDGKMIGFDREVTGRREAEQETDWTRRLR